MIYAKAIVIGVGLLAGGAMMSGPAATSEGGKRFEIAATGTGAWRVDTYTGRMLWCNTEAPKTTKTVGESELTVLRGSGGRRVVCYDADGKVDVKLF